MAELVNVPGGAELWKVGDVSYLVYYTPEVPGIDRPPVPMVWKVERPQDVQDLFPVGANIQYDRTLTQAEFNSTAPLNMGTRQELANASLHPFDTFVANFTKELDIRPWLADPDMFAVVTSAILEGRAPTDAEFKTTNWWKNHNEAERQWMQLFESDPATAQSRLDDNRIQVRNLMMKAGIADAPDAITNFIADHWTRGSWSNTFAQEQVRLLADPTLRYKLQPELLAMLTSGEHAVDTTRAGEDRVRATIQEYLGPYFGNNWKDENIQYWASQLRQDPDAEQNLTDTLRKNFKALFPAYSDLEGATYESVVAPWRNLWFSSWGQDPDETDPLFLQVVNANDASVASGLLQQEGLKRGVSRVVDRTLGDLLQASGGQIRPVQ